MTTKIYNIPAIAAAICKEQNKHLERKKSLKYYTDVITKYYDTVCDAVYKGVLLARGDQLEGEWIPVSFTGIREAFNTRLTQPDGTKIYWYKYLQAHYPLLTVHRNGYKNNNKGEYAMVTTTIDIEVLLAGKSTKDLIKHLYPDLELLETDQCDWVPIDLQSLGNYIKSNTAITERNPTLNNNLKQARIIFDVAEYFEGNFPQIIKESIFGRRYYKGVSLQSSPKIVRQAALGHCHSYDISASVFAWKFWAAKDIDPEIKLPGTIDYLDFKSTQRKRLTYAVYGNTSDYNVKRIKAAFAAIGFGARAQNGVWKDNNGNTQYSALNSSLGRKDFVEKFLADEWVKEFIEEQKAINKLLFAAFKEVASAEVKALIQGDAKVLTEARAIAYMYQQAERSLIEKAMRVAEDDEVLLLVHDGFYTRRAAHRVDVKEVIANEFAVPGYTMPSCDHEECQPYAYADRDVVSEHKEHILREGRAAEEKVRSQWKFAGVSQDQINAREIRRQQYLKQSRGNYAVDGFYKGSYNGDQSYTDEFDDE